jgi:hypothetical protein
MDIDASEGEILQCPNIPFQAVDRVLDDLNPRDDVLLDDAY